MMKRAKIGCGVVLATVMLLAGCGGSDDDYSKYVTLGDYKNLSVELSVEEVTEEELEEYRQEVLSPYLSYHELTGDTPIADGNFVELSLLAKEGSEVLYDFVDDGYEMTVGDEEFGVEVDEALIGCRAGDTLDFTVAHDMDFEDAVLAGKSVSYQIEIVKVAEIIYPEVTDEFVAENFDEESVEAWEETVYEELYSNHQADAADEMREDLLQMAVDNCEITGYPKALYKEQKARLAADYQSYADMFGCTLDDVYNMFGMDEQAREEECENTTYRLMVLELIREQENITLTDEELEEQLEEFAIYNEYDSVEELLADYDREELKAYFLQEMTLDFLEENADVSIVTAVE